MPQDTAATQGFSKGLSLYSFILGSFFAASAVPTPLYRLYQERFALSPLSTSLIFAAYAVALLAALLIAGTVSDHLGRRMVIFAALLLEAASMIIFIEAEGLNALIGARIVQGVATGMAATSLGAALLDIDRDRSQLINAIAPLIGMGAGALGASLLIDYAPAPMQLCYAVLCLIFLLQASLVWTVPESGGRRNGLLASLAPRIAVPARARRTLLRISPGNIANWGLGGFYLSLIPALVAGRIGSQAALTGGTVVAGLMGSAALAVAIRRRQSASGNLVFGTGFACTGLILVALGDGMGSLPLLLLGTLITGAGFGSNFLGALGSILPLAAPDERAGLLSAFYVESYIAMSLLAMLAGYLTRWIGASATIDVYAAGLILLMLAGLAAQNWPRGVKA